MGTGFRALATCVGIAALGCNAPSLSGQTIRGTLLDSATGEPIGMGYVALLSETGEVLEDHITRDDGRFALAHAQPGSFLLLGSALGYRETTAGVFDLGPDGRLDVEFRLVTEPLTLDGLLVQVDRVAEEPALARNGFYQRMLTGMGHFVTPVEIEESPAFSTPQLLQGIPGVFVTGGGMMGERVSIQGPGLRCDPIILVDGMRVDAQNAIGGSLESIVPLQTVEAIEVYRRMSETPIEFSVAGSAGIPELPGYLRRGVGTIENNASPPASARCGVIVFWTKGG